MNADTVLTLVTTVMAAAAFAVAGLRWLRVAQREHYIAGWVSRIAALWYHRRPLNLLVLAVALALAVAAWFMPWLSVLALAVAAMLPLGLRLRGTSAPLAWTARTKRLAVAYGVAAVLLVAVLLGVLDEAVLDDGALGAGILVVLVILVPVIMDGLLVPMNVLEKKLSNKYLVSARKRLGQVKPTVVAITGSYGKTSTKGYVAHVLDGSFTVVASPASFNNLMGLSRAVNDRVVPGTEVFVAEMGVYGPGEIRELSKSFPPDIAAITIIGEAHLARMGSREVILAAKSEITERARTVVLPIDQPELAALAERCRAEGKKVFTVATTPGADADVVLDAAAGQLTVRQGTQTVALPVTVPNVGHAVNIAVTAGIALALEVPAAAIAGKLQNLPGAQHRAEIQYTAQGVAIVDDTYNSNPVGAARALHGAAELAAERGGPLVVVTPGMVELGSVQFQRNREFAAAVIAAGGHLLTVGRTNRAALEAGATGGTSGAANASGRVQTFDTRDAAVHAALGLAGERGVILYENDLPDHYP